MNEQTHSIADYLKPFLTHFLPLETGASENTVLSYRDTIKLLLCFAEKGLHKAIDTINVEDLDMELVLAFLDYLEEQRGCTANTRNQRLAALRTLFKYIGRQTPELLHHAHRVCSIRLKNTVDKPVEYLTEEELSAITAQIDQSTDLGRRDYALVLLMFNTGARVSEITALRLDDVTLQSHGKIDIVGKGNKPRCCVLWKDTVIALQRYLQVRAPVDANETHLFLNATADPLGRFGVRHILKKYGAMAEATCPSLAGKVMTPHLMRHSTAMHLLISGLEIAMIALWLGHASPQTTHKYVVCNVQMKRQIIEGINVPKTKRPKRKWHQPDILKSLDAIREGHLDYV